MQVISILPVNKIEPYKKYEVQKTNNSSNTIYSNYSLAFQSGQVVKKTITSKVSQEKDKLLRHLKDILAKNVSLKSGEDMVLEIAIRAHALINMKNKRIDEIGREIQYIWESTILNPQQKLEMANKLRKEYNHLEKMNPYELPKEEYKISKDEDYDFALVNKLKSAALADNFNLSKIYLEHYADLKNMKTIEELKEKYPTIKVPKSPREVIVQKIVDVLPREFYENLDDLFKSENPNLVAGKIADYLAVTLPSLSEMCGIEHTDELFEKVGHRLAQRILEIYQDLVAKGTMSSIPQTRKSYVPAITDLDRKLLQVDYDSFVLNILAQQYLEGKKVNNIEYKEAGYTISGASLKSSEYKFEKVPEKIKKLISDGEKIKTILRDYQAYTTTELKTRLENLAKSNLCDDEEVLEKVIDFNSCKFTNEDKQYLIKFLRIADEINDGIINLDEGVELIKNNNIKPHGTVKLDEEERKKLEEKLKAEQKNAKVLNRLRDEFDNAINKLYEYNLSSIADDFSRFSPKDLSENSVAEAKKIIDIINESSKLKDSNKIKNVILRWKIYNEYLEAFPDSEEFKQAQLYGSTFVEDEVSERIGQYLLNREFVDNYPKSKDLIPNSEIFDKIMEKFEDKDTATKYLCKYEDYVMLKEDDQKSIFSILEIFDYKDSNDKILLKNIIENNYVNSDTSIKSNINSGEITPVIKSEAKKAILDKYKFPVCIDLFKAFEEAMRYNAGDVGASGVKRTGTKNYALEHKMEVKVKGYPDRLFSSKNNYEFDLYSERGLH